VDKSYNGGEIAEYQYYDHTSRMWDDTACQAATNTNSTRCVKMDCHMPDTHFSLLGFFKEPKYFDWMEQLFKYQGDCVWTDEEYQFMQSDRDAWPRGCTATMYKENDQLLYYDLKPEEYGGMSIGLYTDSNCIEEYKGSLTAEEVMQKMVCGGYVDGGDDAEYMCSNSSDGGRRP
jgi:hypothetical protein